MSSKKVQVCFSLSTFDPPFFIPVFYIVLNRQILCQDQFSFSFEAKYLRTLKNRVVLSVVKAEECVLFLAGEKVFF
jgi:hypothetical protein